MTETSAPTQTLLRTILRPLVRLCIRRSIVFTEVLEALKGEFAEQARLEISRRGANVTFSKISAMTALTRREVKRLALGEPPAAEQQSLSARVLSHWETSRRYQNRRGAPRPLYLSRGKSDFRELVESISHDIDPATMLFELERVGAVIRGDDGSIILKKTEVPYQQIPEKALNLVLRNVESMIKSAEDNLEQVNPIKNHFTRTEYYDLDAQAADKIRRWLYEEGAKFHKNVRAFLSRFDTGLKSELGAERRCRVVFSSYSVTEIEQ